MSMNTLNRMTTLTNSLTGQFGFWLRLLKPQNQPDQCRMRVNTGYNYDSMSRLLTCCIRLEPPRWTAQAIPTTMPEIG